MLVKLKLKVKKLNLNKNMFLCLKSLPCSIYHDHNQPKKNAKIPKLLNDHDVPSKKSHY